MRKRTLTRFFGENFFRKEFCSVLFSFSAVKTSFFSSAACLQFIGFIRTFCECVDHNYAITAERLIPSDLHFAKEDRNLFTFFRFCSFCLPIFFGIFIVILIVQLNCFDWF